MKTYDTQYETEVIAYFRHKADEYDRVDEQVYWNLSDKLLWDVMTEHILAKLPNCFTFMDAGGGTGRWTARILESYPRARGILYDLSVEMSQKAVEKGRKGGFAQRLEVVNGKLEDVGTAMAGRQVDLIFNFHNVLGFVQEVDSVVAQLSKLLKPGGLFVSFVPNRYHNIFFNIFVGNIPEAEEPLKRGRGRFTTDMPYMHLFTPAGLRSLYSRSGLQVEWITGFPNLIYPGMQETQLRGSSQQLQNILKQNDHFERIYRLEKHVLVENDIAARGNNLFAVGRKM